MDSHTLSLSNTRQSMSFYIIKATLYCMLVAISVVWFTNILFPNVGNLNPELSLTSLLTWLVLAPLLCTCALIITFSVFSRYVKQAHYLAFSCALLGAIILLFIMPMLAGVVFSLCFVLSLAYFYWDEHSRGHAVLVTLILNVIIFIMALLFA